MAYSTVSWDDHNSIQHKMQLILQVGNLLSTGPSCVCLCLQPVMLFNPGKISSTSRLLLERGIAMVVVGFPATPLLSARARICISASHTREDLDWALQVSYYLPHAACPLTLLQLLLQLLCLLACANLGPLL